MKRKLVMVGIAVALLLLVINFLLFTIIWDGGFPAIEYRVLLVDSEGKPVPEATMRVVYSDGEPAVRYPVVQFDGSNAIRPDADGVFTFHQINSGLQFGGRYTKIFGILVRGNDSAPQYTCQFYAAGGLVLSKSFNELDDGFDSRSAKTVRHKFSRREIFSPSIPTKFSEA